MSDAGPFSRALGLIAEVEPREVKAVVISFVYFLLLSVLAQLRYSCHRGLEAT